MTQVFLAPAYASHKSKEEKAGHNSAGIKDGGNNNASKDSSESAPCLSWISVLQQPRAAVLCIHGLGLYSGSYKNFGKHLARLGINVYAIDVRGFGSWMRNGGHEQVDFDGCLSDIKTTLKSIRAANPGLPVFLLGESMGGAVALRAASLYPDLMSGVISSVPSGERFKQKKTDLKVALQYLKGANKQFDVGSAIVDQATDNPKLRADWSKNPLDRMDLSPKELIQFQSFMNDNHDSVKKIMNLSVLMIEGNDDKLVKPEGTWELYNEVASDKRTFLAVRSEHLIYEEQQDKERLADMRINRITAAWILSHLDDEPTNILKSGSSTVGSAPQNGSAVGATGGAQPGQDSELQKAVSDIMMGNHNAAASSLQGLLKREPFNGEAHYWLGIALVKSGDLPAARNEFSTSISLGNDQAHARAANKYLAAMKSKDSVSAAATAIDAELEKMNKETYSVNHFDLTQGVPTVLAFYAPWVEQCKDIAPMFQQAQMRYGPRLKLVQLNVDDANSKSLMADYKVGPVPTFVFLTADGNAAKTRIGMSSFIDFAKNITTILP